MTEPDTNADDGWTLRAWGQDFHAAACTLTRLPLPAPAADVALLPRVRRAYPMVGAFVGLAAGGVFFAAHDVGLPLAVNAVLAVAALILVGGHMDDRGSRAAAPLMVATMLKISSLYVLGNAATPGGGPHMIVLALVAAGALSHAAALLLEPDAQQSEDDDDDDDRGSNVVIMPPDGTQITEAEMDEGNGRELGAPATAIIFALVVTAAALGLIAGVVAAAGATAGAWLAPRILAREIDAQTLPMPLALQQSAEVWALMALAVLLSV